MSPKQIQVGKTYRNKGAGKTQRTVLEIGTHLQAPWYSMSKRPEEPVVKFSQRNAEYTLYLSSFAQWVGFEVV
jgi:hypothetical protein